MKNQWDEKYDVIIVGSGFAGLAAAIEAGKSGASVTVLEKMRAPGGNSIISDGGIAAPCTDLQKAHGIKDSPELFFKDMMTAGMGLNHPTLLRVLTEHAAEAFRWSADYLGVEYLDRVDRFGGHSVPRCYTAAGITGATIMKPLLKKLQELGIPLRRGVCLRKLLVEDGTVTGVVVEEGYAFRKSGGGTLKRLKAGKGVVMATGGFGADVPFRAVQDPRLSGEIDTTNQKFSTSEALVELLRIGAAPVQLSHIQLGPWASPDETGFGDGPRFADYIGFLYGIIVHPDTGKRFVNEHADRKVLSDAILRAGKPCVCLADATGVEKSGVCIEKALRKGVVRTFPDLGELARYHGLPAENLAGAVNRFNETVLPGRDDEPGRDDQQKRGDELGRDILPGSSPIQTPPFYSMRLFPKVHYTMGGIRIDEDARVIGLDHQPIAGLYAAGEVTGGIHGACRLGSCAITDCLVFGRIAGRNAGRNAVRNAGRENG